MRLPKMQTWEEFKRFDGAKPMDRLWIGQSQGQVGAQLSNARMELKAQDGVQCDIMS